MIYHPEFVIDWNNNRLFKKYLDQIDAENKKHKTVKY